MSLMSSRTQQKTAIKAQSSFPLTFEALGQDSGLILYESIIKNFLTDPAKGNIQFTSKLLFCRFLSTKSSNLSTTNFIFDMKIDKININNL